MNRRQTAATAAPGAGFRFFLANLRAQRTAVEQAVALFRQAERAAAQSYAAEWLLDNFHLVEQTYLQVREDMPRGFLRKLPAVASGPLTGQPRILAIVLDFVAKEHAHVTGDGLERLQRLIHLFQDVQTEAPLRMAEVWAVPVMLRVAVLEALAQSLARVHTVISYAGIPGAAFPDDLLREQAVPSCVTSLRAFVTQDWRAFFEAASDVERRLRSEKAGIYPRMDANTRDRYRKVIEELADRTGVHEADVAKAALETAGGAHVGHVLLGARRHELEGVIDYLPGFAERARRACTARPTLVYLGGIGVLSGLLLTIVADYAQRTGAGGLTVVLIAVLGLPALAQIAVSIVDWLILQSMPPAVLARMDFAEHDSGIPADRMAVVVIPAILTGAADVAGLILQLELHYLRNPDPHLRFALLTDFADAAEPETPADRALLAQAVAGVHDLGDRYGAKSASPFYLLHRERRWNPREGLWMGWERKRGKLHELNVLLRSSDPAATSYRTLVGDLAALRRARYVITLDTDSVLQPNDARRLIATFAHPLNEARFDEASGRLAEGYTILQPRVEVLPVSATLTRFASLFSGDTGLDPYTRAVSNVYQDLFGEGIYVGKGSYDVDAFERSLAGRVPENALLSHDLFEGMHGRVALLTDVVVYEDYPPNYLVHMRRSRRWVRGDWQLLPWLFPRVPHAGPGRIKNSLSVIHRWQMLDNLRRSLVAPCLTGLLLLGWLWLPGSPAVWTLACLSTLGVPVVTGSLNAGLKAMRNGTLRGVLRPARDGLVRFVLGVCFLPYESIEVAGGIAQTLVRMVVTRRHLLQWTTAAQAVRAFGEDISSARTWQKMLPAAAYTSAVVAAVAMLHTDALPECVPVTLLWLLSPQIAYWIGQPLRQQPQPLHPERILLLRRIARLSWAFFEQFVGPEQHWLPPDNFQESPKGMVMPQTSPTNIGLMLLSTLAAFDFGYLGLPELVSRLQLAFESIGKLEHHRGHLLNWHSSRNLQPLQPRYVSTVDSGNYLASLVTLANACRELRTVAVLRWARWEGCIDTLRMFDEALARLTDPGADAVSLRSRLAGMVRDVQVLGREPSGTWSALLVEFLDKRLPVAARELMEVLGEHGAGLDPDALRAVRGAFDRVQQHFMQMRREWDVLAPVGDLLEPSRSLADPAGRPANPVALDLLNALDAIAQQCQARFAAMDFGFLFDHRRHLLRIGYNVDSDRLDDNCYDLLASESRIASVLAIAKGDVPAEHWMHLGRPVTEEGGTLTLLSWSATMFEYLMPALWMASYPGTLLHQSRIGAVDAQIRFGRSRNKPWGISESGFHGFDASLNYQYQAFGVPGLGFKRESGDSLVVAPYATLLALPVRPKEAADNLARLAGMGMLGPFGMYEAVDFTPAHVTVGEDHAIVRSYMAHHQAMGFLSLANYLLDSPMVRRFQADPRVQSVALLLQEKLPERLPAGRRDLAAADPSQAPAINAPAGTGVSAWDVPWPSTTPLVHVLSNGRYTTMITNAGGGYCVWKGIDLTRWKPDTTLDDSGTWVYLDDLADGDRWSATHQPVRAAAEDGAVRFHPHMAEFRVRHKGITSLLEVLVAPDDDVEIRRVTLTNHGDAPRTVRATSYGEVILCPQAADRRHPAFNKLFIEKEIVAGAHTLLFWRRPRSPAEATTPLFLAHTAALPRGAPPETARCECATDRARFWAGKGGRAVAGPDDDLDPMYSVSHTLEIAPHSTEQLAFVTVVATARQRAISLARRFQTWRLIDRAFDVARTRANVELRRLDMDGALLPAAQHVLSALLYPSAALRAPPARLAANTRGQSSLWAFGISGDNPILLARVHGEDDLGAIRELVQAHTYWRNRGMQIDLVLQLLQPSSYNQELHGQVQRLLERMNSLTWLGRRGGIYIVSGDTIAEADRALLDASARVLVDPARGSLAGQLQEALRSPDTLPPFMPERFGADTTDEPAPPLERPADLQFDNGLGGFSADGAEYCIHLAPGQSTPAPWVNIVANPDFGFLISERGTGYTWAVNSGENRITPWCNDPVKDTPGEALYLRDEETAEVWSPTPAPCPARRPYRISHGAGYSAFAHHSHGLVQHTRFFAARASPAKIVQLRMRNTSGRPRRITATFYAELVMGVTRDTAQQYVVTEFDNDSQTLLARNPYNAEFSAQITFVAASKRLHGLTADRAEFLGRAGDYARPAALARIGLASRVGAGLDPCAALQLHFDLAPGAEEQVHFILGQAASRDDALRLSRHFQDPGVARDELHAVHREWDGILGAVQVRTPNRALDLMLNHWLPYQALACRIWGRSGFYQSSGAYGFRDQLQDVLALVHAQPELAREHLLRAARQQFTEGDVLHWWHPPTGRGVRTRFADDLLWLPYVTARYVRATGDVGVLEESGPFLSGPPLMPDEEDRYGLNAETHETGSLYEHCRRAIERGATSGPHGLPLMGGGDWNDGMNRVGAAGHGESVWLGWFLGATLLEFADVCERTDRSAQAARYRLQAHALAATIEAHAWDGAWYLRAFFDDGTPLGTRLADECQIDAIAQSWAVLSGLGESARAAQAMLAVQDRLVRPADRLVLLLAPPFDRSVQDPGYIRAYAPGIRENGGQYTHAAVWTAWAFAAMGQGDTAAGLFDLLNPIHHTNTRERTEHYKAEPYVLAADVYALPGRVGRGGWTWYTGSAGWMYRLGLEAILGIQREGDSLRIKPCVPTDWPGYEVSYRVGATIRLIKVLRVGTSLEITVNGQRLDGDTFHLGV